MGVSIFFFTEAIRLAQPVALLYALFSWAGLSLFLLGLSNFYISRFALIAPVFGLATLACVLTPLSLLGCPIEKIAWPVFFLFSVINSVSIFIFRKKISRRVLKQAVSHVVFMVSAFCTVVLVSTFIMTVAGQTKVTDVWGNGDNLVYWRVGDYLIKYPSQTQAYDRQLIFRNDLTRAHLEKFSRTGSMATLSFAAVIAGEQTVENWINPFIVICLVALLGLLKLAADGLRWRLGFAWPVIMVQSYIYFPLLFSYLNQIHSTLTIFAAAILFIFSLGIRTSRAAFFVSGVLAAAATLTHPLGLLLAPTFFVMTLVTIFFARRKQQLSLKNARLTALSFFFLAGYYFIRSAREVLTQSGGSSFVGWTWPTLPASLTLLSLSPVLGANELQIAIPIWEEALIACLLLALIVWSLRSLRELFLFIPLLLSWCVWQILPALALIEGKENASHIWVKILSVFAPFLLVAIAHAAGHFFKRFFGRRAVVTSALFFFVWFILSLRALSFSTRQWPMYGHELVDLVRSQLTAQKKLMIQTQFDFRKTPAFHYGAIVGNDDQVAAMAADLIAPGTQTVVPTLFCWDRRQTLSGQVQIEKGVYACGLPPTSLSFETHLIQIWQLSLPAADPTEFSPSNDFLLSAPAGIRYLNFLFANGHPDFHFAVRWNGRPMTNVILRKGETQAAIKLPADTVTTPYAVIGLVPLDPINPASGTVALRSIYFSQK